MRRFYDLHSALAQPLAVEALYLDRNHLQELPDSILAFKNLRLLNLSDNQLVNLPDWIGQFSQLQTLDLSKNQFKALPVVLKHCAALEILDLQANHLEVVSDQYLPTTISQLNLSENRLGKLQLKKTFPKLKILRLNRNKLTSFPKIKAAPALKTIALFQNKIKKWPKDSRAIYGLEKLYLGRNLLKNISENIGFLKALKYLDLSKNKLTELPNSLGACLQLRNLNLAGNQLSKLPTSLEKLSWLVDLDLSENNFEEAPKVLQNLQRLDRLGLSRNQLGPKLKFQFPKTLRVLDLSHNPIKKISLLPPQLKQLSLRKMDLKTFKFLRQLLELEQLDLRLSTLSTLPESIYYLSQLKQLRGLLASGPKKHLLQLLNKDLSPKVRKELYDFWYNKTLPTQSTLLKGLALSIPGLSKKVIAQLLKQTQVEYPKLPSKIRSIRILGRLTTTKTILTKKLKTAGIQISEDSHWCILGRGPFLGLASNPSFYFFNEAQLLMRLEENKTPQENQLSQAQKAKLERLLLHPNPRQVKMALLLLEGTPIGKELLPALIAAWKLQVDPRLKRQLSDKVQQNQHADYEQLRNSKMPNLELEAIFQWLENAGLDRKHYQHWETFF